MERERRPEVEQIQRIQAQPPRLLLNDARWAFHLLSVLAWVPALLPRRVLARSAARLATGVEDVRVAV